MRLEILERELKKGYLELRDFDYCYLLAIKNTHPKIFKQFKEFIEKIDDCKEVEE